VLVFIVFMTTITHLVILPQAILFGVLPSEGSWPWLAGAAKDIFWLGVWLSAAGLRLSAAVTRGAKGQGPLPVCLFDAANLVGCARICTTAVHFFMWRGWLAATATCSNQYVYRSFVWRVRVSRPA
jgi:hypothetical protein